MTDLLYLRQFELVMDDWHNGQLSLEDAHDALVRLGHDPEDASDLLQKHDRRRFERETQRINGELAGVI
jgi:hypothetical protein